MFQRLKSLLASTLALGVSLIGGVAIATDGTVDGSFGASGAVVFDNEWTTTPFLGAEQVVEFTPENSIIDSQGRVVVVGRAMNVNGGNYLAALLRISQDGVVDSTFGDEGLVTFNYGSGSSVALDVVESSAANGYLVYTQNGGLDERIGPAIDTQVVTKVPFDGAISTDPWFWATAPRSDSRFTTRPVGMPVLADGSRFSIVTRGFSFGEMIWNEFDAATAALTGANNDFLFSGPVDNGQVLSAFQTGASGSENFHIIVSDFQALNMYTYDRDYVTSYTKVTTPLSTGLSPMTANSNADMPLTLSDGSVVAPVVDHRDTEGDNGPQGITGKVGLVKVSSSGSLDTGFSSDGMLVIEGITASNAVGPTYVDIAEVPGSAGGIAVSGTASNGNAQLTVIALDGSVRLAATELSSTACQGATKTIVANSSGEIFGFGVNPAGQFVMVKFSTGGVTGSACGQVAAPGAPTLGTITPGDQQLSVAFTTPSSDGGAAINNYEYSTDGGSTFTAMSPATTTSPLVISGLTNGTAYQVQIRAVNSAGAGTASASVAATPVAPASGDSGGSGSGETTGSVPSSDSTDTTAPATTVPATTVPATTVPGSSPATPTLVTSSNQELLAASAGSAKILINGELVEVELVQASEELRRTVGGARSFAQVRALQTLAEDMVAAVQAVLGEGATLPITVTSTETGATISGLVTDPVTGDALPVPVEDVLLILNENLVLMVGGADGTNNPANIAFDGVLEFGEGGYVAVLAYGLTPGAAGEVVVMSTPQLLDTFTVGTDGGVAAQAAIPADLAPGEHTVVVAVDGQSASLGFRVLSAGVLPVTGGSSSLPSALAVLLAAAGAFGVLVVSRRRHTA